MRILDWFLPPSLVALNQWNVLFRARMLLSIILFGSIIIFCYIFSTNSNDLLFTSMYILLFCSCLVTLAVFKLDFLSLEFICRVLSIILWVIFALFTASQKGHNTGTIMWFIPCLTLNFMLVSNWWALCQTALTLIFVTINWHLKDSLTTPPPSSWTAEAWRVNILFDHLVSISVTAMSIYFYNKNRERNELEIVAFQKKDLEQQKLLLKNSRMAELGEVAGGIAHEINNPLAIILAQTNIIAKKIKLHSQQAATPQCSEIISLTTHLSKIEATSMRISKIITGMSAYAQDAEDDPLERFELKILLDEVNNMFEEKLSRHAINLSFELAQEHLTIFGKRVQIYQVMVDLINNAFDAINQRPAGWIKISAEEKNRRVIIKIYDSGPGIPEELREKVLRPFFTTKAPGKGTGLGLSIVNKIMNQHAGKLNLTNEKGVHCISLEFPQN
jgi:signal transduction histidine kinase